MTSATLSQLPTSSAEETRKQLNRLFEEVARLAESSLAPADFYGEFLKRVLMPLGAPAGAVWLRGEQGPRCAFEINLRHVGLDEENQANRKRHDEFLRWALSQGRPLHLPPGSKTELPTEDNAAPGNPIHCHVLLAPILVDQQVAGLVEIWYQPDFQVQNMPAHVPYLTRMADLASQYQRNQQRRQLVDQQKLWTQLETYAQKVHVSLHPTEVAYLVAAEGRRLVECDRLSVAVRQGQRASIEAVSGVEVIEKRSNLVQRMRALGERVLAWGETLVYRGSPDDSLPPAVHQALDAYLAVSSCKLLVVLPLRDERDVQGQPRAALLMECFEPATAPEPLIGRLEVVGRHAASALRNAAEHRRIPMRWLWQPLARLQEGLGGKTRALVTLIIVAVQALMGMLILVPYPLKVDARGQLLPEERRWIYSPVEGQVVRFEEGVQPGSLVAENQSLVLLYDVQLEIKLVQLNNDIAGAEQDIAALARQLALAQNENERLRFSAEKKQKEFFRDRKILERKALRERTHADEARPGNFWLKSPMNGTVLSWDFREKLTNKNVTPAEPLVRLGDRDKRWEIELKIPQKHIGQLLKAFDAGPPGGELDVDLLLLSAPTRTFKGKLARDQIAGEAVPNHDNDNDAEPVVLASVRIDGPDIAEADRLPRELLVTGTEVHSKVRCGQHALGYSLFYGMWEFFYEKVLFFF